MVKLELSNGTKLNISDDVFGAMLVENSIGYNDYIEFAVRKKLGQNLADLKEYKRFKVSNNDHATRAEHLRFDMGGQRDGEGGLAANKEIFKLFDLPITLRSSYDYEEYSPNDYGNIFIFHKGCPILMQRDKSGQLQEIEEYGGEGTVDILVKLILKFSSINEQVISI